MSDPKPFHLVRGDATPSDDVRDRELARLRSEIEARNRQETAIAELGQAALTGVDPSILLGQACALVELTLQVGHCRALEITVGGRMSVRAAIGTNATFLHCTRDVDEDESLGMVTLLADAPLTFSDLTGETRFKATHLHHYHGVRSGVGVVIRTQYGPWGVLLAYCSEQRIFTDYEMAFVRSVANIVGEAIARARTEHALRKSEARLRQVIAAAFDTVITLDRAGTVIEWNPQAEATFGMAAREVLGQPLRASLFPERQMRFLHAVLRRFRQGRRSGWMRRRLETVARRANGELFPVEITLAPAGSGSDQTFTAFIRDISERQQAQRDLEQREQRFRTIVEKSWSGVALLDPELRFSFVGSSTPHLIGYEDHELLGRSIFEFVHPREIDVARRFFSIVTTSPNREAHGELRFRHKNGSWVWLEGFSQNLLDEPSVGAVVLNYRDIS
ncbi:MAG TPA: PAS domain S-box protein, partial [Thermoanaerobaculia bacterium]